MNVWTWDVDEEITSSEDVEKLASYHGCEMVKADGGPGVRARLEQKPATGRLAKLAEISGRESLEKANGTGQPVAAYDRYLPDIDRDQVSASI